MYQQYLVIEYTSQLHLHKHDIWISILNLYNITKWKGGTTGLVVMGGDSYSKGHEFESWHHILDGHFFTYLIVVKFVMCIWKDENKWKRGRVGPFNITKAKLVLSAYQMNTHVKLVQSHKVNWQFLNLYKKHTMYLPSLGYKNNCFKDKLSVCVLVSQAIIILPTVSCQI